MSARIVELADRPGLVVMDAIVGSSLELFEIRRLESGEFIYWVRLLTVPREVFFDALAIAQVDKFDPAEAQRLSSSSLTQSEDDN